MSNLKITSDGKCNNSKVTVDGVEITRIKKVEIKPISPESAIIEAVITVYAPIVEFSDFNDGDE